MWFGGKRRHSTKHWRKIQNNQVDEIRFLLIPTFSISHYCGDSFSLSLLFSIRSIHSKHAVAHDDDPFDSVLFSFCVTLSLKRFPDTNTSHQSTPDKCQTIVNWVLNRPNCMGLELKRNSSEKKPFIRCVREWNGQTMIRSRIMACAHAQIESQMTLSFVCTTATATKMNRKFLLRKRNTMKCVFVSINCRCRATKRTEFRFTMNAKWQMLRESERYRAILSHILKASAPYDEFGVNDGEERRRNTFLYKLFRYYYYYETFWLL